jgi:hypothetical protein
VQGTLARLFAPPILILEHGALQIPAAFGHFIHIANSNDGLSDHGWEDVGVGSYGPYMQVLKRFTQPNVDGSSKVIIVLPVWNPCNTMLMLTKLRQRS